MRTKYRPDPSGKLHTHYPEVDSRRITGDDAAAVVGLVVGLGAIIAGVSVL
jgi:hypothetical protein